MTSCTERFLSDGTQVTMPVISAIVCLPVSAWLLMDNCVISSTYKRSLVTGGVLLLLAFYLLSTRTQIKQFSGETMGTTYHVSYVASRWGAPVDAISKVVYDVLHDVDLRMSTYREDSELMKFNRSPVGQPVKVSKDIVDLFVESRRISELSGGGYDVTVGPLVNLWGFGPSGHDLKDKPGSQSESEGSESVKGPAFIEWMMNNYPGKIPTKAEIDAAKARVGYHYVTADVKNSTLERKTSVFVDLSSIAKGYAVDQAGKALKKAGIDNFMVEVGGEIKVSGHKADGSDWRLAVRGPDLAGGRPVAIVSLDNKGMATSGDYLNYFEVKGKRYSHTINPKTGYPEANRLAEVAVISDTVEEADGLATMFMVLGDKKGLELANRKGIAAYFTYHYDGGFRSLASKAFKPYLVE